jgi:hypothetical protein
MHRRKNIRILSLCDDPGLRRSRELLLNSAGYEVVSAPDGADPTQAAAGCTVAVLCHSFLPFQAADLTRKLRECNPAIRFLQITSNLRGRYEVADLECWIYDGPHMFLDRVAYLVSSLASTAISCKEHRRQISHPPGLRNPVPTRSGREPSLGSPWGAVGVAIDADLFGSLVHIIEDDSRTKLGMLGRAVLPLRL